GYSSLSYLHRFPLNTLKIDRSFINNLQGDRSNLEIVQAIITLAHTLGMDAIAEGIETPAQLAQLQALGCEYGQGYFFSPPLPVDAAEKLIASSFAEESGKLL
ncbi:MAG: EAL domain-containing protein, partial [Jaaginema sp. PMC 1079.18]|nr:EAL domain-containing protein [Jaaginema sp. PMC 1079.18]